MGEIVRGWIVDDVVIVDGVGLLLGGRINAVVT